LYGVTRGDWRKERGSTGRGNPRRAWGGRGKQYVGGIGRKTFIGKALLSPLEGASKRERKQGDDRFAKGLRQERGEGRGAVGGVPN